MSTSDVESVGILFFRTPEDGAEGTWTIAHEDENPKDSPYIEVFVGKARLASFLKAGEAWAEEYDDNDW